jgi:hypothetical protein
MKLSGITCAIHLQKKKGRKKYHSPIASMVSLDFVFGDVSHQHTQPFQDIEHSVLLSKAVKIYQTNKKEYAHSSIVLWYGRT